MCTLEIHIKSDPGEDDDYDVNENENRVLY